MARNPNWSRDELILALDLYMCHCERLRSCAPIARVADNFGVEGNARARERTRRDFKTTNLLTAKFSTERRARTGQRP
jgi:hypothetical protein